MNIYIDFDDCVCDTGKAFSGLAFELFGISVPYEKMRFFNLQKAFGLTDRQYGELLEKGHEPAVLLSYEETPGASAAVREWISRGHQVSVITGRPFSAYSVSRQWLDSHGLQEAALYCLDKYGRENHVPNSDFSLTPDDYFRMRFDYAVEDSPSAFRFFSHLPDLRVMVFDRPWNREAPFPGANYRRCFSWEDIRANTAL